MRNTWNLYNQGVTEKENISVNWSCVCLCEMTMREQWYRLVGSHSLGGEMVKTRSLNTNFVKTFYFPKQIFLPG